MKKNNYKIKYDAESGTWMLDIFIESTGMWKFVDFFVTEKDAQDFGVSVPEGWMAV